MSRYVLAATALIVAVLAAWAMSGRPGDRRSTFESFQLGTPRATADAVRATVSLALTPPPTPGSSMLRRDVMIDRAMTQARAMGEQTPRLVDFRLVTVAKLTDTNYVSLGEEATTYGPPSRQVYVVRVAGHFTPLDLPYEVDDTWPRRGIAYTVYDAATGDMLGGGLMTDNPPAGTPPFAR